MNLVKLIIVITNIILLVIITGAKAPRIVSGPESIPHINESMLTADFWIDQLSSPDQVLISANDYKYLIKKWSAKDLISDIVHFPNEIKQNQVRLWLKEDFSYLKRVGRYQADGRLLQNEQYNKIISNVNLDQLKGSLITSRWGLMVSGATMRLFPTNQIITAKAKDIEFNILAHSALEFAEPVVVLHHSQDKKWLFVVSAIGRGWVPTDTVGLAKQKKQVLDYIQQATKVLIEPKVQLTIAGHEQVVKMGCTIAPYKKNHAKVPIRDDDGHLAITTIILNEPHAWSAQFLQPTARTMINQAFKLLGQPYGWGGSQGIGDCSELIRRIGLCCGMIWPRSTIGLEQGFYSTAIKLNQPVKFRSGQTLLTLPGHVMLVIGQIKDKTYVIHNLYGIHGQDSQGPVIKRVARVIVSDLSLGQGSHKGSLKNRVNKKIEFQPRLDKMSEFE